MKYTPGDIIAYNFENKDYEHYMILEIKEKQEIYYTLCLTTGKYKTWRVENAHIFCRKVA